MALTGFSPKVRELALERSGGICECCAAAPVQQLHHRRARGAGGSKRVDTNEVSNLFAICEPCHRHIESHRAEALVNGWLVRQGKNPAGTEILYRKTDWAFLTPDGSIIFL